MPTTIQIDRAFMFLQKCARRDNNAGSPELMGVCIEPICEESHTGLAVVTNGHLLVVSPLLEPYDGPPVVVKVRSDRQFASKSKKKEPESVFVDLDYDLAWKTVSPDENGYKFRAFLTDKNRPVAVGILQLGENNIFYPAWRHIVPKEVFKNKLPENKDAKVVGVNIDYLNTVRLALGHTKFQSVLVIRGGSEVIFVHSAMNKEPLFSFMPFGLVMPISVMPIKVNNGT